jgi:uncharacterized protein involved in exopolysaccharide biosynthesis
MESFLTVLFRQKTLIFTLFAIVLGAVAMITFFMPRMYESRMKVLVKNERSDLVVSPDARDNAPPREDVSENQVNSEIELLTTNDLLTRVVRKCRLEKSDSGVDAHSPQDYSKGIERAVLTLRRNMKVTPVRKANVIQITYLASSPEQAASVLKELAAAYLDAHLSIHNVAGTQNFFGKETMRYAAELRSVQDRLTRFRREQNLTSVPEQKDLLLRKAMDFETALRETDAALAESESRLSELRMQVSALEPRVLTQSRAVPNQYSVERLNTMLAELENRRTGALLKFRPEDPFVREIEQEISDTQTARDRAAKLVSVEQSTDLNPLRNAFEGDFARAQLQEVGLKARRESLVRTIANYRTRLAQVEGATMEHEDLERRLRQAEENFLLYTRKGEESRIANALDTQKIANVAIAEHPIEQYLPVRPNVSLNLTLGALLALFVSLAAAFGVELTGSSFHVPSEIEAVMHLPVLATVPFETAKVHNAT